MSLCPKAVAHELAHNLNAKHDTEPMGCAAEDHYIMSALGGVFSKNLQYFSACSIAAFKDYLLDRKEHKASKNAWCLGNSAKNLPLVEATVDRLPGLNWSPDEQCRQVYGQRAIFARVKAKTSC